MPKINRFNELVYRLLERLGVNALCRWRNRGKIKVLLFHNTPDAEQFASQLRYLMSRYNIVRLDEHGQWQGLSRDRINLLLTFDDGFESNYHIAFPILKEHGVSGCFCLISDRVADGAPPEFAKKYAHAEEGYLFRRTINEEQAREMLRGGMTIASHGCQHADFSFLTINEAVKTALASRDELSRMLGIEISVFAFPFGHCRTEQLKALKPHFQRLMMADHGFNEPDSTIIFRNEVSGSYHMYAGASGALDLIRSARDWIERLAAPPIKDSSSAFDGSQC